MEFASLHLAPPLLKALEEENYVTSTPIQAQSIPIILKGRDLLGIAQTGTGKTAAFALPLLHLLQAEHSRKHQPQILVLAPTRELAIQIHDGFRTYGRHLSFRSVVVVGGANLRQQADHIRNGIDILIATPGRLIDLMQQRLVDLSHVNKLVLDEADRMLDMGFIQPIRQIVAKLPKQRQTLLFSATMPNEIRELAEQLLKNPEEVNIAPAQPTADRIEQAIYFVDKVSKPALFAHLFESLPMSRVIAFTRTKHGADKLVKQLRGFDIHAEAIHGNKSQNNRQRSLSMFKSGKTPVLVATDIAARGIDVDLISHVVNFDLTHEPETYVHRIGRTARAGEKGMAVSFCAADELENLKYIEKLIKKEIPSREDHPYHAAHVAAARFKRHGGPRGAMAGAPLQRHERPRAPLPQPKVEREAPTPHPLHVQREPHRAPAHEHVAGESPRREHAAREHGSRDHGPREHGSRDQANRGQSAPSGKKSHRKGQHRDSGPQEGPREHHPLHQGARSGGPRRDDSRHEGARHEGTRHDRPRHDGPRPDSGRPAYGKSSHGKPGQRGDNRGRPASGGPRDGRPQGGRPQGGRPQGGPGAGKRPGVNKFRGGGKKH